MQEPLKPTLNDINSEKIRTISVRRNRSAADIVNKILEGVLSDKIQRIAIQTNKSEEEIACAILNAVQLYDETTIILFDQKAQITAANNGPKLKFRRTISFK